MFEKVNPHHPDKLADRIAGAIVDCAYSVTDNPKIAVEVLIGHGNCKIIAESSVKISTGTVYEIVQRILGEKDWKTIQSFEYIEVPQDEHLALNQKNGFRCGDNGIFKGMPITEENRNLTKLAQAIYDKYGTDGKYIIDDKTKRLIICQSCAPTVDEIKDIVNECGLGDYETVINPLGYWTGSIDTDTGATNRKLGSDMAESITGGGLHGKDLSKADVSLNIYAWLKAQLLNEPVELYCAIGDDTVNGIPYSKFVEIARTYIKSIGGFEKFAEWGYVGVSPELLDVVRLEALKKNEG